MHYVLIILLLLVVTGTVLLLLGMRGRRVGDHPLCRRCGFDLFGQPAGTVVCSECGRSLADRRAIVIGHHTRRPQLVRGGLLVLVPLLIFAGLLGWGKVNSVDWYHYAPLALLDRLAISTNASTRTAAIGELNTRLNSGLLSASQRSRVFDTGLGYQGDLSKPWDSAWGDLLEAAHFNGQLSSVQWTRYVSQVASTCMSIRVRPRIRLGDPLYYWIDSDGTRAASRSRLLVKTTDPQFVWPGQVGLAIQNQNVSVSTMSLSGSMGTSFPADRFPSGLKPGLMSVHYKADLIAGPRGFNGFAPETVAKCSVELPATFTLLPADQPSVTIIHDPSLAEAIQKSLTAEVYKNGSSGVTCTITVNNPPVGLAFEVLVAGGNGGSAQGTFACPAGTHDHGYGVGGISTLPPGKLIDVILRAKPDAAKSTTDTFSVWDGDIVLKDVPVH